MPQKARSVILDHDDDWPLIHSIVPRRYPTVGPLAPVRIGRIKRGLEPVWILLLQTQCVEVPDRRQHDLRCKWERRNNVPRSDGAIVWSKRHAARKVSKKLAVDTFNPAHGRSGTIACGNSPAVLGVVLELLRILNCVFLLHQRGAAAIFEIIDSLPPHWFVLNAAKIQP